MIVFGENVRALRKLRGLTQEDLAWAIYQHSGSYISEVENAHHSPSFGTTCMLAHALGVHPATFWVDGSKDNMLLNYKSLSPINKREIRRYIEFKLIEQGGRGV